MPDSSEKSLERELADEIRGAIASARPPAVPDSAARDEAPDPVRLAEAHAVPSVPPGARAGALKALLVRAFRFLWRDQSAFNTLALEAFRRQRREFQSELAHWRGVTEAELAFLHRRAAVQDGRFGLLEEVRAHPAGSVPMPAISGPPPELPPAVYSLFEERFRGSPESIAANQRFYLPIVRQSSGPVLDVGCGRGEFLELLRGEGVPASGIESNPVSVRLCREAGLDVSQGDAVALLAARPAGSLGAVVAFQVVEHWPAAAIFAFLRGARRALRPGGVLVVETVNTDSLSALRTFFLDPTHVRPVPAAALAFLAEAAGFVEPRIEYRAPVPAEERLREESENDARLNRLLYGPQDYALVARAPEGGGGGDPAGVPTP